MKRFWVIAPFSVEDKFYDKVWEFDLDQGCISIGWHELGDASTANKDRFRELYIQSHKSAALSTVTRTVNMIWNFFHEIKKGDVILARKGTKSLAAVGIVQREAYFDEDKRKPLSDVYTDYKHCSWLDIEWQVAPRNKIYDNQIVFGIQTVYEIDESEYRILVDDSPSDELEIYESIPDRQQFYLEEHLEQYIVDNFPAILGPRRE